MRTLFAFCLTLLAASPALAAACDMSVGSYIFEEGDVKSTSVVHGTDSKAVVSKKAGKALLALSQQPDAANPVAVRIGSYRNNLLLKDMLGQDETAPGMLEGTAISIPGGSTADGLVLQQAMNGCK